MHRHLHFFSKEFSNSDLSLGVLNQDKRLSFFLKSRIQHMLAKCQNSLRQNMLSSFGDTELILVTVSNFSPRYFRAQKIEQKEFAFFFSLSRVYSFSRMSAKPTILLDVYSVIHIPIINSSNKEHSKIKL